MPKKNPRILLTVGEPAGIGADIILNAIQHFYPRKLTIVTDPDLLCARAKELGLSFALDSLNSMDIIPVKLRTPVQVGKLDERNADFVLECLEKAADECLKKQADALVTGPVHKAIINQAGFAFSGHTEFLAKYCNAPEVLMLFVTSKIKSALITTHLALADVSKNITIERVLHKIKLLDSELKNRFHIKKPVILVCGLNPHAGESGELGREEIDIISPALKILTAEGMEVRGPFAADTIFTENYLKQADVIVGMYHDQVLPVIKYSDFQQAVNMTLGLPIIRTSVDHGVALDKAGTGQADPSSLIAAIELAIKLLRINP